MNNHAAESHDASWIILYLCNIRILIMLKLHGKKR